MMHSGGLESHKKSAFGFWNSLNGIMNSLVLLVICKNYQSIFDIWGNQSNLSPLFENFTTRIAIIYVYSICSFKNNLTLLKTNVFDCVQYFLITFKFFWPLSKVISYLINLHIWPWSKILNKIKKIWMQPKIFLS